MRTFLAFNDAAVDTATGVAYKNLQLKKKLLVYLAKEEVVTITNLSREFGLSITKINDLLLELQKEGIIRACGKSVAGVGRRPTTFGLDPDSFFFLGVEVKNRYVNIGLMNFKKELVKTDEKIAFQPENTPASLEALFGIIENFIKSLPVKREKIQGIGINFTGRINNITGRSYNYFNFTGEPLGKVIENRTGIPTYLENDARAMAYGEFHKGVVKNESNVLFVNIDYGIGLGCYFDGKIYRGKSGYAGEFGHIPIFENEKLCLCGKKGCLDTEASGRVLVEQFIKRLKEGATSILTQKVQDIDSITLDNIIEAANMDDTLAIELIAGIGEKLGKGIATLINLYNPDLIVLGGSLSLTGDFILLPVKSATKKYSLSIINNDTNIKLSTLGERAGIIGACMLVLDKRLLSI